MQGEVTGGLGETGAGHCFTYKRCSPWGVLGGAAGQAGGGSEDGGGGEKEMRVPGRSDTRSQPQTAGGLPGGGDTGSSGPRQPRLAMRGSQGSSRDTHPE